MFSNGKVKVLDIVDLVDLGSAYFAKTKIFLLKVL